MPGQANNISPKVILAVSLFTVLFIIVLVAVKLTPSQPLKNSNSIMKPSPPAPETTVTIQVIRETDTTFKLSLVPKGNYTLSGFSLRFTISQTASFTPSPDLIADNWLFPINTTATGKDGQLVLDISGLNITPGGYNFSNELPLGTIGANSPLTIDIDKSETKILDTQALELNYSFKTQ